MDYELSITHGAVLLVGVLLGWIIAKISGGARADKGLSHLPDAQVRPAINTHAVQVAGESNYQDALEEICGGRTFEGADAEVRALLILEDDNPFDPNAVRVVIEGSTVGYLERNVAPFYRGWLEKSNRGNANFACDAVIRGGWDRGRGDTGHFGVTLFLPTKPEN